MVPGGGNRWNAPLIPDQDYSIQTFSTLTDRRGGSGAKLDLETFFHLFSRFIGLNFSFRPVLVQTVYALFTAHT